jgi:hypothetical protein
MSARQNVSVHVQCTMFQRAVCNVYHARVIKFCFNQCVMLQCSTKAFKHIFYRYSYQ